MCQLIFCGYERMDGYAYILICRYHMTKELPGRIWWLGLLLLFFSVLGYCLLILNCGREMAG